MILYFYPPVGGTSMSRNVRNVQYLPRYGWSPVVLTPRNAAFYLQDRRALDLIPAGTRVIRTRIVEAAHVRAVVLGLLGSLARHIRRRGPSAHGSRGGKSAPALAAGPSRLERVRQRLFFPDDQVGWLPFALLAAMRAHHATPFQAVYSTASPITAHVVAGLFKRLTGVPWVAEFRDPWVGNPLTAPLPWFHRRLQARLERWIVRSADRVVGLSPGITRLYRARYPDGPEMVTITSGYDRGEARADRTTRTRSEGNGSRRFEIVYTGTLDRPAELETFLEGVDRLVARRPELSERLALTFLGFVSDPCRVVVQRYSGGRLEGIVELRGFVPRSDALDALARADAALILLGPGPGMGVFIGGKLFDYIGQDLQILAMLPPGDARDILEGLDWGVVCDPDPDAVGTAIERLIAFPPPDRPADPAGAYDRAVLAGRVAVTLNAVAGTASGAGPTAEP